VAHQLPGAAAGESGGQCGTPSQEREAAEAATTTTTASTGAGPAGAAGAAAATVAAAAASSGNSILKIEDRRSLAMIGLVVPSYTEQQLTISSSMLRYDEVYIHARGRLWRPERGRAKV